MTWGEWAGETVDASPKIAPLGEAAAVITLGETIDPGTHAKVCGLSNRLERQPLPGMIEYIPAFTTVTVVYDPLQNSFAGISAALRQMVAALDDEPPPCGRTMDVPVCYGGEFGTDLEVVAEHNALQPSEVVQIHCAGEYLVYMIGFAPGFPYLGGMSPRIATPRKASPRLSVPAGSVGIAGGQTGIYPLAGPGGWQLIGRSPLQLFRPTISPPTLLMAGDRVRFRPINPEKFASLLEAAG